MTSPLLRVRDLRVDLAIGGRFLPAVNGVDLDLDAGEALAVVGESGCGKSLTARALTGLEPDGAVVGGSVFYRGSDLRRATERQWRAVRGREIGLVFQEPAAALDPVQTIGAQIREALRAEERAPRALAMREARRLLEEVGFSDPDRGLGEYAHRLSGGQRQRACLAIALAARPSVLIADEPTTSLDATLAADVLDLLDRLRRERGLALLLITHDFAVVARHTDRALVMYAGRVVEEASTPALLRSPKHPYAQALLACVPVAGRLVVGERFPAIAGSVPDLGSRLEGACSFAPRCPARFEPCDHREPSLFRAGESCARCFLYEPPAAAREGAPRAGAVP